MINRQSGKFTTVLNSVVNDPKLSAKAKGIYIYLQSKKDGWQFYEVEIIKHFKDGRDAIRSGIKELIDNGYLLKYQEIGKGIFTPATWILNPAEDDYLTYENAETVSVRSVDGKSVDGKSPTNKTNNNNTNSNKTNSNKNTKSISIGVSQVAFDMWCDYKGSKYSAKQKTLIQNKLKKFDPATQLEMVETAIMNSWKGLFELKGNNTFQKNNAPVGSLEWERLEALKNDTGVTDAELI